MFFGHALHRSDSVGRQLLLWLTVAAFAFRAFMPVGFMPDVKALQSGKLVLTLCTAGGGTAFTTLDLSDDADNAPGTRRSSADSGPSGLFAVLAMHAAPPMPVRRAVQSPDKPATVYFLALPPLAKQGPTLGSRAPPANLG